MIGNDPVGKQPTLDIVTAIQLEVTEIENHIHNYEKWFGLAAVPAAETHRADRMDGVISTFQLVAGASDFGAWVQVLGSSDTPVQAGKTKFDLHRMLVVTTNSTNPFIIQLIRGESADFATKLAAEDFDELPYVSATNNGDSGISDILDKRYDSGEKVWMRCANVGGSGTLIDFYIGIHEYDV